MTPEQIRAIISAEYLKGEAKGYPSLVWSSVAAKKISEEIENYYYYSPFLAVLFRNREKCLHWDVVGDFCGKPYSATTHLMCENCSKLVTDIISLSQPSKHIVSEDDSLGLRREKEGGNSLADAGELKTENEVSSAQQHVSVFPKYAPRNGHEPAMGDEQRNNSPAATESVANSHSKDTSQLPENGDALASLETHVNAVSHRVTKSGCTQDVGSSEETAGEIPMCWMCKAQSQDKKAIQHSQDCGCSCHKEKGVR